MRILGLDFGSKTIGVAVCDPFGWTAQGLEIIRREEENKFKKKHCSYFRIVQRIRRREHRFRFA